MQRIEVETDVGGIVLVALKDFDTFNHVDDYLVEEYGLEPLWVKVDNKEGIYVLAYEAHLLERIKSAISAFIDNE